MTSNAGHPYPGLYTGMAEQGVPKPRRGRKNNKGESSRKRKMTKHQINVLEMNFGLYHKLSTERKCQLASNLGLDPYQVVVWFQNRRAKLKSKKLEDEFSKLSRLENKVRSKFHAMRELAIDF